MESIIQNAIIESSQITTGERGFLTVWMHVNYGVASQGFGGYVLYLPKNYTNHKINSPAGHFIFRVMQIAGVENWKDINGKAIRVKGTWNHIEEIGHIIKDDWFNPKKDFEDSEGEW